MNLCYDEIADILMLSRLEGDPLERIEMGHITLDMSTSNSVRGLEIRKASQFFKAHKKDLMKARDADLYPTTTSLVLEITLRTKGSSKPSRIAVPIELP